MQQAFDTIAENYDSTFTHSKIGKAQREIVWNYLDNILANKKNLKILELNCGTGEDAIWFAKRGHSVLATDQSDKMIQITRQKAIDNKLSDFIEMKKVDLINIEDSNLSKTYDLIFSNFGGINCLTFDDLYKLPDVLNKLINPSGRIIMTIMPTFCVWEMIYFTIKLNLKKAFRRSSTKRVKVNLNGEELSVEYYTPVLVNKLFSKHFRQVGLKPVGFFIPPSYLEKYFRSKHKTFNYLQKLESIVTDWSLLSNNSDHFLIDLIKK